MKARYLDHNGPRARGGAGPTGKKAQKTDVSGLLEPAEYDARIKAFVDEEKYAEADKLQKQQDLLRVDMADGSEELDDLEGSATEHSSDATGNEAKEADAETRVLKMLYKGNIEELSRQDEQHKKAHVFNRKHNCYRNTRCTSMAQEEQSALPAGVINTYEDSDDDAAYLGDQKEIAKEWQELQVAQQWINLETTDLAEQARAKSPNTNKIVELKRDWGEVKQILQKGAEGGGGEDDANQVDEAAVLRDYPLDALDPTQRAFANRVLKWADELAAVYTAVEKDGKHRHLPVLRSYLGGSAGSGKSTTLRTCVQHIRLMFMKLKIAAQVVLTAYTGVAAFNIGFGARTACSAFQIFPNAAWKSELQGEALRKLENTWEDVVLLIIDEISFIGKALFARMHFRTQQGKRAYFSKYGLDPMEYQFGGISMILVGDFGQLDPIDDWSLCDTEATYTTCPKPRRYLWKHSRYGTQLLGEFKEAVMLKRIHRSKEDMWWTESCLRLRDFTCTFEGDYKEWMKHDLKGDHLNEDQKKYFEDEALWLCSRCEDVGQRNGRKLARMAIDEQEVIHKLKAQHSHRSKSVKNLSAAAFGGLRSDVHLVRGCKMVLTRNVSYKYGLANGTRGKFIGIVYGDGGMHELPEAIIGEFPDYCGPAIYADEPKWVPILPITSIKDGTRVSRTQFPLVAGFALTVNKAQGLTVKEGVVIWLNGGNSRNFRPASKHGHAFVAFTRSESFAMTAFKNLPAWHDFCKGRDSDMLRMRLAFTEKLDPWPYYKNSWRCTYSPSKSISQNRPKESCFERDLLLTRSAFDRV